MAINWSARKAQAKGVFKVVRDREFPLKRVHGRSEMVEVAGQHIPPVVYQTGPDQKVGRTHWKAIEAFRDMNPEFRFCYASDADAFDYMRTHYRGEDILDVFERTQLGPMRADIYRYCVILKEGGVYLDVSKALSTPLRSIIGHRDGAALSYERNEAPAEVSAHVRRPQGLEPFMVVQWCICAPPGHRFLVRMLENIVKAAPVYEGVVHSSAKEAGLRLTGPYMWTRSIWEEVSRDTTDDYAILGFDYGEPSFPVIPGSHVNYLIRPHYSHRKDLVVLRSRSDSS